MTSHDDTGPIDAEEMERFYQALMKCRNCSHIKMTHSFLGMFKKVGKCVDASLVSDGVYKACHCRLFEPADNLEYLEYKYDEKKKKKGRK
jgi:hypothetical protein